MDNSGIPLASDGDTVVKERLYLDKADPDIMHNVITTVDHASRSPGRCRVSISACMTPGRRKIIAPRKTA
jgi:hypothetical protein